MLLLELPAVAVLLAVDGVVLRLAEVVLLLGVAVPAALRLALELAEATLLEGVLMLLLLEELAEATVLEGVDEAIDLEGVDERLARFLSHPPLRLLFGTKRSALLFVVTSGA